ADFSFGPDPAAVSQHDTLDECQADSGAFEIVDAVQPLKYAEQLRAVLHIESHAVVSHEIRVLSPAFLESDLNGRILFRAREFDCVRNQVIQNLPDHGSIAESSRN